MNDNSTQNKPRKWRLVAANTALSIATASVLLSGTVASAADSLAADGDPAAETGLPFQETFANGVADWVPVGTGSTAVWSAGAETFDYVRLNNLTQGSGSYLRPAAAIDLPEAYQIDLVARVDAVSGGSMSVFTDFHSPYSATQRHSAVQFTGSRVKVAQPNGTVVCDGLAPITPGEWFNLRITRAGGILAVRVDGTLVGSVDATAAGGSIGLGGYKLDGGFGALTVAALDSIPSDHPTSAQGCGWTPGTVVDEQRAAIVNQTGYDLGAPKHFTAPLAADGDSFQVIDSDDRVVYEGTVAGGIGDFTAFDPDSTGPYRILLETESDGDESYEFGIGANWTDRISYENAVGFMTDARCFYGELAGKPLNGTDQACKNGLGWRDSHQMSFELPALVDLYFANPTAIGAITMPDAVYEGIEYPTVEGAPEVARLIAWAAEIYLRGGYDHALVKEQLASFLWAYPELSEWIPVELYEDVRDYLFPIWSEAAYGGPVWYDYTAHTADLTQVYTQIGTGKGEFPVGHSIIPNLRMWEVAEREGRADAEVYLDAAVAQAQWIIDNIDVADVTVTKGQRQAEYHLMTALATVAATVQQESMPTGLVEFAEHWAEVVIERSDNMWDFRRYSDDRWTIPNFSGGGGADPNEVGNVLGLPAAALAAATLIDDDATDARLAEIAQAHVDSVFGRNPTGRAAQYRVNDPDVAFEGLDAGWYSELLGWGFLTEARGVFDGGPKNDHYPYNPAIGSVGHTEGWVAFNTAWLESLAWHAATSTTIEVDAASAPVDGTVGVTLRAPLNMDPAGGNTGEVRVALDGVPVTTLTVSQTAVNALDYVGELDLSRLGAESGQTVTVSYGLGSFAHVAEITITEDGGENPGSGTVPPTTSITPQDPSTFDPELELDPADIRLLNGELIADLGTVAAGEWFYGVVHSDPLELGWFRAAGTGRVTIPVPTSLPAGTHTLALYNATGALAAYGSFTLEAPPGSDLVTAGIPTGGIVLALTVATMALLAGLGLVLRRRKRVS